MRMVFLGDLIDAVTERGRKLLSLEPRGGQNGATPEQLLALSRRLLTMRGEASGVALARSILDGYFDLPSPNRMDFLQLLTEELGPETARLDRAIARYRQTGAVEDIGDIHDAAEPQRQELIRRLNMAPCGTLDLVRMREDVLAGLREGKKLAPLDGDFRHLFSSWFNRGFLVLHYVDWATPANILEKIIRYEAVHEIADWNELRRRLAPADRRCFAFFHPRLADEPLIFVEVALTREIPTAIAPLLTPDRQPIAGGEATTAVFYSISNCQPGLAGVSFGNFLIKQVVEELKKEFPALKTFVTLSPVPGFAKWLAQERGSLNSPFLAPAEKERLERLLDPETVAAARQSGELRDLIMPLSAAYFLKARQSNGKLYDPVARFHLGNGARLESINWLGDTSPKSLEQGHGLMVNYLYDLETIIENHESFANGGEVQAASAVRKLLKPEHAALRDLSRKTSAQGH